MCKACLDFLIAFYAHQQQIQDALDPPAEVPA
jgi:hypothetical protein